MFYKITFELKHHNNKELSLDKKILSGIVELIKKSNKITVFTGAGISTSCGIPDFRGPNGLYTLVQKKYNLPYPEAIFEINFFKKDPKPFYNQSKELFNTNIKPSLTHKFIAWLEEKNKIALVMTQNIDMLHKIAGNSKVIECHGTYSTAHCLNCQKTYNIKDIEIQMKNGEVPYCSCGGIIKPDVVFFSEQLPMDFFEAYQNPPETDLLLVMGSSLTVQPAAGFALKLTGFATSIIVNLEPTMYDALFNFSIKEDLDTFSRQVWDAL
jgi:NAD-dependent histone deacetylase SIR2